MLERPLPPQRSDVASQRQARMNDVVHRVDCFIAIGGETCSCEAEEVKWREPATAWARDPEADYLLDLVAAVRHRECEPECMFAWVTTPCHCRCLGYYHGALGKKVVGSYDDPRAKWDPETGQVETHNVG